MLASSDYLRKLHVRQQRFSKHFFKGDTFGLKGQGRESKVTMIEKQGRKDKLPGKIER
jgi:hypothetical protein